MIYSIRPAIATMEVRINVITDNVINQGKIYFLAPIIFIKKKTLRLLLSWRKSDKKVQYNFRRKKKTWLKQLNRFRNVLYKFILKRNKDFKKLYQFMFYYKSKTFY